MLDQIRNTDEIDKLKSFIKQVDALKVALECVGAFREQSIKYAQLEAETLIRIVELGGLSDLRGWHKKTAEWLYSLSSNQRAQYISMCSDGMTIDNVYKREVSDPAKLEEKTSKIYKELDRCVEKLRSDGIVNMEEFNAFVYETIGKTNLANDIIDGSRKRLRDSGGKGCGFGTCLYVKSKPENKSLIRDALITRICSIYTDMKSISSICKKAEISVDSSVFCGALLSLITPDELYFKSIALALICSKALPATESIVEYVDGVTIPDEVILEKTAKENGVSK